MHNKTLARLLRGIDATSDWSGKILSYLLVLIVIILIYEVVARYVFDSPTVWAHEASVLAFATYSVMLGAYAHVHGTHVNMDLLYNRLSLRTRAIMDVFTFVFFLFWCGVLLWYGALFAAKAVRFLEHSTTAWGPPIFEVKLMIPLAALLIILQGIAKFIRDLSIATTGRKLE